MADTLAAANLVLGRRVNHLANARDDGVWELFAPDFVQHSGAQTSGAAEARLGDARLFAAIPDTVRTIDHEVADETMLVHGWHFEGTVKATGAPIRWEGCTWMRIENGLIAEGWIYWDPSQLQPRRTDLTHVVVDETGFAMGAHQTATHTGPLMGHAPTGRKLDLELVGFVEVAGGLIVDAYHPCQAALAAAIFEQLGLPQPGTE